MGGTTRISEEVVAAITAKAVGEIPGVAEVGLKTVGRFLAEALGGVERAARGVEAEVGRKEAIVDVTVRISLREQHPRHCGGHPVQRRGPVAGPLWLGGQGDQRPRGWPRVSRSHAGEGRVTRIRQVLKLPPNTRATNKRYENDQGGMQ